MHILLKHIISIISDEHIFTYETIMINRPRLFGKAFFNIYPNTQTHTHKQKQVHPTKIN